MSTHYEVLGVDSRSELASIRAAYVGMIKRLHPDSPNPARDRLTSGEDIYRINLAYSVLRDPLKRAEYDAELARAQLALARDLSGGRWLPATIPQRAKKRRSFAALPFLTVLAALLCLAADRQWHGMSPEPGVSRLVGSDGPEVRLARIADGADADTHPGDIEDSVRLASYLSFDDALAVSARCFGALSRIASLTAADRCIAFDIAFAYWHEGEFNGRSSEAYFMPSALAWRHESALSRLLPDDPDARLFALRSRTFATITAMLAARRLDVTVSDVRKLNRE